MCNAGLIFAANTIFSGLSVGLEYLEQRAQAKAQLEYQRQLGEQQNKFVLDNAQAAIDAYANQAHLQNLQVQEQQQSAAEEIQSNQRDTVRRVGLASASSENAGSVIADILRSNAIGRSQIETNLGFERDQARSNLLSFQSEAQSRINSAQPYVPQPVAFPSAFGAALKFGGRTLDAYDKYLTRKREEERDKNPGGIVKTQQKIGTFSPSNGTSQRTTRPQVTERGRN